MASSGRSFQKLFVANLPWTVGHLELRNYFREFGRVITANVIFDRNTGCSKGYGFVLINGKSAVENIERKQKHILEGNVLQINPSE